MSNEIDEIKGPSNPIGIRLEEEVKRIGGVGKAEDVIRASRATLYNWFKSGLIPAPELAALADIGVDPLYVTVGRKDQGPQLFDASRSAPLGFTAHVSVQVGGKEFLVNPSDYRWVPFYDVEIGAGGGRVVVFNRPPKKFNAYRRDYLAERGLLDADLFEASIIGNSQFPEICDGDVILVNASDRQIRSGEIYVVQIGEEFICKYLRRLPAEPQSLIEVYSKNADEHPPFTVKEGLIGNGIEIIGNVVRHGRERNRGLR